MQKQVSPKIVSLVFAVLVVGFLAVFYVFAWTEPLVAPPGGNVPAPINVGSISQIKEGGFGVYGVFRAVGGADPAVESGLVVNNGDVGIGTDSPSEKLDVAGNVRIRGLSNCDTIDTDANGNLSCGGASGGVFGEWETKSPNTVYQAASDGFVTAFDYGDGQVNGYTDGGNPPTTLRIQDGRYPGMGYEWSGITMPVRKNDYWRVTGADTVYWIPLGG